MPIATHPSRRLRASLLVLASLTTGVLVLGGVNDSSTAGAVTAPNCGAGQVGGVAFRDYNANGIKDSTEPGISGISVTVTNSSGSVVGTATTGSNGAWVVSGVSGAVRVEYSSSIPSGPHGTDSKTTVSFGSSGSCDLSAGFNDPADYCQLNPTMATTCITAGSRLDPSRPNTRGSVLSFPANATGNTTAPTTLATVNQTGSLYGVAYNRCSDIIYASAWTKRHADYGPGGPGAIYAVAADGSSVSTFATVANPGTDTHPAWTGDAVAWMRDPNTFDAVGRMGLGDLELSADCSTLYTVNLNTRSLIKIPVSNPSSQTSTTVPVPPGCSDPRPIGLGWHDGKLFVGGVCSESTTGAHIYVYTYDPATNSFGASPVLNTTYQRGIYAWETWATSWSQLELSPLNSGSGYYVKYQQPMLTDIVFNGDMMIFGMRDRLGDQAGVRNYSSVPGDNTLYWAVPSGDIVVACTSNNLTWTLESAGSCGGVTGYATSNSQGPGGGEFYADQSSPHAESSFGGMAYVQGTGLMETAEDPINLWGGGIMTFSDPTLVATNTYQIYTSFTNSYLYGKANGLGDLEALCDLGHW